MAVPTISALSAVPSRIGDATNFFAESLAFLEAQETFSAECVDVATYLNAAKFNLLDWGGLGAIGGGSSPVVITNYPSLPPTNPPLSGYDLTIAIDDLLQNLSDFVADGNAVASYIDGYTDPSAPVVTDPARPIVHTMADAPARTDGPDAFNSKASSFYTSSVTFATSLQELADYATNYLSSSEDWELISGAITETDDWGSITS